MNLRTQLGPAARRSALLVVLAFFVAPARAQRSPTAGNLAQFTVSQSGNFSNAYQNVPYSGTVVCLGGTLPCTFSVTAGTLPTGITQTGSTGNFASVAGPSGTGTSSFTIIATDSATPPHVSAPLNTSITVNTLVSSTITPTSPQISTGTTGFQLTANGVWSNGCTVNCPNLTTLGTWAPVTFGTGGTIGLHTGLVNAGSTAINPGVTVAFNGVTSTADVVTVTTLSPTVQTSSPLPNCHNGIAYQQTTLAASGGTPPYTWAYGTGSLAGAGLTLSAAGVITGTCAGTTQSPTFIATDSAAHSSAAKSLTVTMEAETSTTDVLVPSSVNVGGTSQGTATAHYSADSTAFPAPAGSGGLGTPIAWQNYLASNTDIDIATTSPAFPATALLAFCPYSGNPAVTFTVTTTPSESTTAAAVVNAGFGDSQTMYYAANSLALTNVHLHATGAANQIGGVVVAIPGAATASPIDGSAVQSGTASGLSLNSASYTNANASDALLNCVAIGQDETSITAGSGFTIPANGSNLRVAAEYQNVSISQANVAGISWGPNGTDAGSTFVGFKAGVSGGTAWQSQDANSSTNASGLVTALSAGTSSVQACFQGNCGTATLTITAPTDSGLVIAPANATCQVGGTVNFSAKGNNSQTDYTTTSTWGSSNNTIASIGANTGIANCLANGSVTITATHAQINGSTSLTVSTGGTASLLHGCTFTGAGGCAIPGGWTLVAQQDFECSGSHASPANPGCTQLPTMETSVSGNVFETIQVHGGTYAFGGQYTGSASDIDWIYGTGGGTGDSSNVGSFASIYLSYWEYTDPNAQHGNSDYYMIHVGSPTLCSGTEQDFAYDAQPGTVNASSNAFMEPIANGNTGNNACQGWYNGANGATSLQMMAGQWRQVEILYTPSTAITPPSSATPQAVCTSSSVPGCGNGTSQLFINGVLSQQSPNADLNGTTSMANSFIEVGGVLTDFCDGFNAQVPATPFSLCPAVAPTPFHRYFDDIIILKQ